MLNSMNYQTFLSLQSTLQKSNAIQPINMKIQVGGNIGSQAEVGNELKYKQMYIMKFKDNLNVALTFYKEMGTNTYLPRRGYQ